MKCVCYDLGVWVLFIKIFFFGCGGGRADFFACLSFLNQQTRKTISTQKMWHKTQQQRSPLVTHLAFEQLPSEGIPWEEFRYFCIYSHAG